MQFIEAGQNFSFNYTTYDQNTGLFVAFSVYNVTTGSAVFVQKINGANIGFGCYSADLMGVAAQTYLIIGLVYTDGTYTTIDTTRAPTADVFQVLQSTTTFFGFALAAFDLASGLDVKATVYKMTSGSPVLDSTDVMTEVLAGVYFGSFSGSVGNTYQIISLVYTDNTFTTPDLSYSPSAQGYDSIHLTPNILVTGTATLTGVNDGEGFGFNPRQPILPPLRFTQGDDFIAFLTAVNGNDGSPIDLTGASFQTIIRESNGNGNLLIPNGQHEANADQVNFRGQFTLTLANADTLLCGLGAHKELLTIITIGTTSVMFRAFNSLQVYPATPFA
jgi:hypothetical protein